MEKPSSKPMLCRHETCGNPIVTFRNGETMIRAKSIVYGMAVLAIAASARAEPSFEMEHSSASASAMYEVDVDRDGRADRLLVLEQSDSLA
jgi:hypothetical protein